MLNTDEGVALYTDGSAYYKDKSGGWAWVALDPDGQTISKSGAVNPATNNQMELQAATEGLNYLYEQYGQLEILVVCDSEYVVYGATDRSRARNRNQSFWTALDAAVDQHEYVEFEHVKGHSGNALNEKCDKLASEARRGGQ